MCRTLYLYCIFLMCLLSSSLLLKESSEISILGVEPNWMTPTFTWETHRKHLQKAHGPETHHCFKPAPIVEASDWSDDVSYRVWADVQSLTQFQYAAAGSLEAALPNTVRAVHQKEDIHSCRASHHCAHTHTNISHWKIFIEHYFPLWINHFCYSPESDEKLT